ncbi:hypothetical protein Dsin_019843 [Dipteronia sinensis]|uniref:Uncharacterized protein n=1 Tax=Dipteronia sinensis TaxID=43782 RepID=A0AAE0E2W9_9ROSI|nr:hypothetical protein Dsin_019843 [Dipteronia sinensis]
MVNSEEEKAPEKWHSSGGATGTGGLCFYSKGLIDLNKTCDEWNDFDSAHGKVIDDPGIEPASFGFDDCRDSSTVKADSVPKDSNFLIPGGSSDGLDEMEGELAEIPFTQLLNSYNIVGPASQESVISTTQHVVDRTTVDTQIHRSAKDVDISIPGTFTELLSSTIVDVSDSQESANSTTPVVDGVMENRRKMEMGSIDLESHNEASPSEIFLFTAKDRGSQEALPEQRIDSDYQNVPLELSLVVKTTEEHLQEERDYSNIQKGPPGFEDVWLVPKSKGISLGHKVPDLGSAEISKAKRISSVIVESPVAVAVPMSSQYLKILHCHRIYTIMEPRYLPVRREHQQGWIMEIKHQRQRE